MSDLVGNKNAVAKILEWLNDWEPTRLGRIKKDMLKCREKQKPINDPNSRCLMITGPPGIGKTSAVRLAARSLNYDVLELNASDVRNKNSIQELLQDLSKSQSIKAALRDHIKTLIVMDEVDGVGGGDRGGLGALL